jgi:hypothetical protein
MGVLSGEAADGKLARVGGVVQCGVTVLIGGVAQVLLLLKLASSLLSLSFLSSI